jgi:AraC-like DNA-binding protein
MIFNNHISAPPIGNHIESIFHFKDFMPDYSMERVVPTGHLYLIFELDDIPRNTFDNETLEPVQTFTYAWISGMQTGCITISVHNRSEMLVVQFKSAGSYPFLHIPVYNLTEKILPAAEIVGNEILTLREKLLFRNTSKGKFELIDEWLNSRFDEMRKAPGEVLRSMSTLQKEAVSDLPKIIDEYPHTRKHLISQFKKYVGVTPKAYQRILRFNEIFHRIQKKEKIVWANIAYQCGYSDQSHFIKEFKRFSGFNPREFIDQWFPMDEPNFFPLDRVGYFFYNTG